MVCSCLARPPLDTRSNTDPGSKIGLNAAVSSGAGCDWLFCGRNRSSSSSAVTVPGCSVCGCVACIGFDCCSAGCCSAVSDVGCSAICDCSADCVCSWADASAALSALSTLPVLSPVSFLSGRATAIGVLGRALNSLSTGIRLFLLPSWDASKGRAAVSVETAATSASVAAASAESATSASISASASACAAASANRSRGLSAATTVS